MRTNGASGAARSEAILLAGLAVLVAVFAAPCIDGGFRPFYVGFDLQNPQACLVDPSVAGDSPTGLMRWSGSRPLRLVPMPLRAGDLVKLNLSTPCEALDVTLEVDGQAVAVLALTPRWHEWSVPLTRAGARLSLSEPRQRDCAVDLSRVSITNTRGTSGPPLAAYLAAPGAHTPGRPVAAAATALGLLTLALGAFALRVFRSAAAALPRRLAMAVAAIGPGVLVLAGVIDRFTANQLILRFPTALIVLAAPIAIALAVRISRRPIATLRVATSSAAARLSAPDLVSDPTLARLADATRRRARVEAGLPIAAAALLVAGFFHALLAAGPGIPLAPGDGWLQNLPARTLVGETLRSGRFPWWDPLIFSGFPTFADVQSAVLYPLTWLFALLAPGPALNLGIALSFVLGFVFTYQLARSWSVPPAGALWSGMLFAFSGFMLGNLGLTNMFHAAIWLPAVLWAHRRFTLTGAWRDASWCALALTVQFYAGHTQTSAYTALTLAAAWVAVWVRDSGAGRRRRTALGAGVAAGLFALLILPQVLATRELLVRSVRTDLSFHDFGLGTFTPAQLGGTVVPYLFAEGQYGATWATFMGIGSLALAAIAVARRRDGDGALAWGAAAAAGLVLAMGPRLPIVGEVLHHLPVIGAFRVSRRWQVLITLAVAILAGKGLGRLCEAAGRGEARRALGPAVAFLLALTSIALLVVTAAPALGPAWLEARVSLLHPRGLVALAMLTAYLAWCAWWWLGGSRRTAVAVFGLLGVLELASFNAHAEWHAVLRQPEAFSRPVTAPLSAWSDGVRRELQRSHQRALTLLSLTDWGIRDPVRLRDIFMPNVNLYTGIANATGYSPLAPRPYLAATGIDPYGGAVDGDAQRRLLLRQNDLLDLLAVRWVVADRALAYRLTATPPRPGAAIVNSDVIATGPLTLDGVVVRQTPWTPFRREAPARTWSFTPDRPVTADTLVLVSATAGVPPGSSVGAIRLVLVDGSVLTRPIVVGRDTADVCFHDDRPPLTVVAHGTAGARAVFLHGAVWRGDSPARIARLELTPDVPGTGTWSVRSLALAGPDGTLDLTPLAEPVAPLHDLVLQRRDSALPHAWVVGAARQMSHENTIAWLRGEPGAARLDPATTVTLAEPPSPGSAGPRERGTASETTVEPGRTVVRVESPQGGWLVVSEAWSPSWSARIDGGPWRPVRRAYELIQAVEVPPGTHQVELSYRPTLVWASFSLAFAGCLLALILLVRGGAPAVEMPDGAPTPLSR